MVLFDNVALNSMDKVTLEFFKNCSTQIIMIPQFPFPARGAEIKNFLMPLMYTFLMVNRHLINRVIFADIFDCLFQRDPFSSEFIKKGEIHLVRELFTNENHLGKLNWPRCYFHDFKWVRSYDFQINSGYFAGYIDEFLIFMNVFCKYTKYNRCMDQGIVNIIYQLNMLDPYGVKISPIRQDEWIHQMPLHRLNRGFPYVQGNYLENVTASIVHLYYHGTNEFFRSVLKHCPRVSNTMKNYLSKKGDVNYLEIGLDKWDQNAGYEFGHIT